MSLFKVFDVAGSAMNAQSVRMNTTASNLANAGSVSGDPEKVYRARHPVFASFSESLAEQTGVSRRATSPTIPRPMRTAMCMSATSTRSRRWST